MSKSSDVDIMLYLNKVELLLNIYVFCQRLFLIYKYLG